MSKSLKKPEKSDPIDDAYDKRAEIDHQFLASHFQKKRSQHKAPILKDNGDNTLAISDEDFSLNYFSIENAFGTTSFHFSQMAMNALVNAVCQGNFANNETMANAALHVMHGFAPQDEFESMIAAQLAASHFAIMNSMAQFNATSPGKAQDRALNTTTKLMRAFSSHIEALQRYRTKGQQKMTVEHVHVNEGGQAIIGNVSHGGGNKRKRNDQSHAPEKE